VVVATDAVEIAAACIEWGARVEMTSPDHESGTSRVAEVVSRPEYSGYDVVVNVQGDEPFIEESHVAEAVAQVARGFDIGTVAAPVGTLAAWRDPGVVKVVRRPDGGALYFSRSPIPHVRGGDPDAGTRWRPRRTCGTWGCTRTGRRAGAVERAAGGAAGVGSSGWSSCARWRQG
jgi:3-deoxy-manno-octulosonate cytidylyltransferase (CMP-KDO synthetase)